MQNMWKAWKWRTGLILCRQGGKVILVTPSSLVFFSCGSQSTLANQWVPLPDLWMGKLRNRQRSSHAQGCPVYQPGIAPISCCCSAASTRSYWLRMLIQLKFMQKHRWITTNTSMQTTKEIVFSDQKYAMRTVCSIWPWHPHSNLPWDWKRQWALLMTWSALSPLLSMQVALESFHSL